jgi:hypothetical protein
MDFSSRQNEPSNDRHSEEPLFERGMTKPKLD